MFSDKFAREPERINPQWEARLALEASGVRVLDLAGSNPTTVGIPYPEGIPSLLARPDILRYHPHPKGSPVARQEIADYYASRGRVVDPEDLVLTASTSEAYSHLFKLLCDPGDEILIPSPTYPLFDALAELENVELVRYPLRLTDRWRADFGFLRSMVSTRSKALILVNPNNPTGHLADGAEIRAYLEFATEHGLALIVDEVFCDYLLGDRAFLPIVSDGPLVFTLNGFSKTLGLPQVKLGWIHAGGGRSEAAAALGHLEWIADAYLSVNTPVQAAAGDLLRHRQAIQSAIQARLERNLQSAEEATGGSGPATGPVKALRPDAGWSLVLDVDVPQDDEAFALGLMQRRHVNVHPGHLFGFETGCRIVVSLLGNEAEFREGLQLIEAHAAEIIDG
ncbi:MAG: aminotransferase [Fibrobacteres bacterium]|nr:aminotransferase [Fibrobacterota bacterium]